jgi:hypothetical protein
MIEITDTCGHGAENCLTHSPFQKNIRLARNSFTFAATQTIVIHCHSERSEESALSRAAKKQIPRFARNDNDLGTYFSRRFIVMQDWKSKGKAYERGDYGLTKTSICIPSAAARSLG